MRKRFLIFVLIATMFTGCNDTKKGDVVPDTESSKSDKELENIYESNEENLEILKENNIDALKFSEYFSNISYISESGEKLYVMGDTEGKTSSEYLIYNFQSGEKTEKNIDLSCGIQAMDLSGDRLCIVYENEEENFNIKVADLSKEEVYDFPVDELYISDVYELDGKIFYTSASDKFCIVDMETKEKKEYTLPFSLEDFSVRYFTVDERGYIYFFCSDIAGNRTLFKFDSDLNEVFSNSEFTDMGGFAFQLSSYKDGNLILATTEQEITYINIVDSQTGETIDRFELKDVYGFFTGYKGYDIVYFSSNSLYGYNFDTQNETLLCSDIANIDEAVIGITSENNILLYKEANNVYEKKILIFDMDGNITDEVNLIKNNNGFIRKSFVDKYGNIYYLEECHSPEFYSKYEEDVPYIVHTITPDGSHTFFEVPVYNNMRYSLFMEVDTSGNVLIGEEDEGIMYLTGYDKNGNKNGKLELTDCVSFHSVAVSGDTVVINYATYGEEDKAIAVRQSSGKVAIVNEYAFDLSGTLISGNDEYDIFIRSGASVYGFDIEENKKTKVLDLISNNISSKEIFGDYVCGNRFYFLTPDGWKNVDINGAKNDKTIINVSGIGIAYVNNLEEAIMKFNSTNDKYQIVCTDYSEGSEGKEKFNLDIVTGKVDIVLFSSGYDISSYDYNKGIFADLYPFIDNDSEISRDDFFKNVLDMYSENGKLYEIVPAFSVGALSTYHEEFADKESWNISEYSDFISKNTDKKMLTIERMYVIDNFLSACVPDFIDEKNNSCNFTDDDFKKILEFLKDGLDDTFDINRYDEESYFLGGSIFSQDYEGNKLYFKGYPSNSKNGVILSPDISFAIMSNSDNKEGAWEFIRTFLSDDYQKKVIEENLPLKVSVLKDYIKKHRRDMVLTDEMIEVYKERVLKADCKSIEGSRLSKIICDEAGLYFAGEATLDETVQAIQSKVTLYLNES